MQLSFRKANLNDAESIANLSNQLGYTSSKTDIQNRLGHILSNTDHIVLVAIEDQKTVGWIHGFYAPKVESDSFVEIGGLIVDENNRGKRIGKQLVEHIYPWAKKMMCQKVRVRCNELRTESHQFYEHLGFKLNKAQKVFDIPVSID